MINNAFKPDYGLFMSTLGLNGDIEQVFYDIPINHLVRVDFYTVTTMVNLVQAGKEFALSLDLDTEKYNTLYSILPVHLKNSVNKWFNDPDSLYSTIEFDSPIMIRKISAKAGGKQTAHNGEEFIPFIVDSFTV